MKIKFRLTDEKTVTNTTVKLTVTIRGTVQDQTREQIEAKCLSAVKQLFPDNKWGFSNFIYNTDGMTYAVVATTRIDSALNERLTERTNEISTSDLKVSVTNVDPSIPQYDLRAAESELRLSIIDLAKKEAKLLKGQLVSVRFIDEVGISLSNSKAFGVTYGGGTEDAPQLGHSEKINLTAEVSVVVA